MAARQETAHARVDQIVAGHFRETPGYGAWRPTGTDDWLLIYTRTGNGRFGYFGGEIKTSGGDIVLIRPGALQDYGVPAGEPKWELLWSHFHPRSTWIELLDWPEVAPGLMCLAIVDAGMRQRIENLAQTVHQSTLSSYPRRLTMAMNALETLLLWCDTLNPRSQQAQIDPRIRIAMDYICSYFARPLTLSDIAAASRLSQSRMAHLFAEQVGVSPQKFVEQQRLARARQLLSFTQRSIKQISCDVGYDDPFYFTRRFRRHVGQSPRAYRLRNGPRPT